MTQIETLDGPLDTSELGTVLMHEHIFNITAEIQIAHPGFNGWDPEVQRTYGWGALGDALNPTRKPVRDLTGQNWVPVLETDDGEVISGSDKIVAWARENPASGADRA